MRGCVRGGVRGVLGVCERVCEGCVRGVQCEGCVRGV